MDHSNTCEQRVENKEEIIIFDLYGTLVDWARNIGSFIEHYIDRQAIRDYFDCDIREVKSYLPYKEILAKCIKEVFSKNNIYPSGELIDSFILIFAKSPPFPDTIYGLRLLRKHGYKLAVLSNTDRDLVEITLHGFRELFDHVVVAEEIKSYKPSRDAFLKAYQVMKTDPSKVIHVSAYPQYDLITAKTLGARTVLLDRGLGYEWEISVKALYELSRVL